MMGSKEKRKKSTISDETRERRKKLRELDKSEEQELIQAKKIDLFATAFKIGG